MVAGWEHLDYGETSTDVKSCVHSVVDVAASSQFADDGYTFDFGSICIVV